MTRRLGFWRRVAWSVVKPSMLVLTSRTWRGAEHLAGTGGLIIAANHTSHIDPMVAAHYVYDAGRWPQFLAKESIFRVRLLGGFLRRVGQVPVSRGTADAARALDAAVAAVEAGDSIIIYPEGTTTKRADRWPMQGKTGVARLWFATRAPVVPMVMWGAHRLYDPHGGKLRLRPRTPVTVVAGPPVDLSRFADAEVTTATLTEVTELIMARLAELLAEVRGEPPPALPAPEPPPAVPAPGTPPGEAR